MRIAFDHQIFSEQVYGGVSRYFFEVARRVQNFEGYDVAILSPLYVNNYLQTDPSLKVWGKHVNQLPPPRRVTQLLNGAMVRWKLHHDRPDLVHETYYSPSTLRSGIPFVTTIHDMIYELFPQHFGGKDRTAELKRLAASRAERIIAVSNSTKRDLVKILGVPENKVDVIYHGNSLSHVPGPSVIPNPYFLHVGGRSGYKNFELSLEAFARSPRLRKDFLFISFGTRPFTHSEQISIRKKGLEGLVRFDSGPDERLATLYGHAEALIYPSQYEGFGLPILEAMHYGCPVICGDNSSIPEVAGPAGAYFDPTSADSLMTRIENLAYDSEERRRYSELGIQQAGRFSWDRCARETAKSYRSV